jgi:hypothetical protein
MFPIYYQQFMTKTAAKLETNLKNKVLVELRILQYLTRHYLISCYLDDETFYCSPVSLQFGQRQLNINKNDLFTTSQNQQLSLLFSDGQVIFEIAI